MWHLLQDTYRTFDYVYRQKGSKPYVSPNTYSRWYGRANPAKYKGVGVRLYGDGYVPHAFTNHAGFLNRGENQLASNNLRAITRNNALTKIDDELTIAASLFEDWYERKQAYALLGDAMGEIYQFTKNWKNPAYWMHKKAAVKPKSMPEAWLTYQFGIQPLVGTINRTITGLALPLGSHSFKGVSGCSYTNELRDRDINHACQHGVLYGNISYLYILGCRVEPTANPNTPLIGLTGLNQPFSSAWSVIPWGWAVDYFVNVSEMLSNIELKHPGLNIHSWYKTEVYTVEYQGKLEENVYAWWEPNAYYYRDEIARLSGMSKSMDRVPLAQPPTFEWTLKFPLLGSNKPANLASAIALSMKDVKK